MLPQFQHFVNSSIKLWVENTILSKGGAFSNYSGQFYQVKTDKTNYFTYALPFKPLVYDASIAGATIMSGVYLDRTFIRPGQSGLIDVNFEQGEIYFSSGVSQTRLSGNYSVADFNVKFTDRPQEDLLLETKFEVKPKLNFGVPSGLGTNETTFPAIYIHTFGGKNEPWAFGGIDQQVTNVRLIILGDSEFNTIGASTIFKDKVRTIIPLLTGISEMPFNNYGGYSNGVFNYTGVMAGRTFMTNSLWVEESAIIPLVGAASAEIRTINPTIFPSFVELNIENYRNPRV